MAIRISVAFSPVPRVVREWTLVLEKSSTLEEAVQATVFKEFPSLDAATLGFGIWGRISSAEEILKDGDRVEVYRSLTVDPKVARRQRFKSQGSRGAGLFAKKRVGRQSGY